MTKDENCGTVKLADGEEIGIMNYIQSDELEGRIWTLLLLEDETIVFQIERKEEGEPYTKQQLRLTKKSVSLLMILLVTIDADFGINSIELLSNMTGDKQAVSFTHPNNEVTNT